MIPKIIHYCWFGNNPKSDLNKQCLDSWHRVMPDYQIKEWNETNWPLDNDYSKAAYDKELWSRLSNYVRLQVLFLEGGIYLDTDVEVIKSFDTLLQHECFLGFQQEQQNADWVNNAVLGAQAGHQFLNRCMELTQQLFAETGEFYRSPTVVTMVLKQMGLTGYGLQQLDNVTVYPCEYFYPYPWFSNFTPACIQENTYCIHYWEATWRKQSPSMLRRPRETAGRMVQGLLRRFG